MSLTDTHSKNGRTLLDRPTYNASQAGRLADLKPDRVRRWLRGYSYSHAGGVHRQEPVIRRSGQRTTAKYASFLELVDLLFVKEFLNEGISLQQLRRALSEAADLLGVTHFARQVFFTEGRRIHLEVGQKGGKALLQLLSGGQWVIAPVILELAKRIDFEETSQLATRWYPRGQTGRIVVDPAIAFGQPTIAGHGIATANVFDLYQAEGGDIDAVCSWWGLSRDEAEAAVEFERGLAA